MSLPSSAPDARTITASLGEPPPRQVPAPVARTLLSGTRAWQRGIAIAAVLCVAGFAALFPWALFEEFDLDRRAVAAEGQVTRVVFSGRAVGANLLDRRQRIYRVEFSYIGPLGQRHSAASLAISSPNPGDRIDIEYDPEYPAVARVRGGFLVAGHYWAGLWACLLPAFLVFGLWNYRYWKRQRHRLLSDGRLTEGRIQQIWGDGSPRNDTGWVAFSFEADGELVQKTEAVDGAVWSTLRDRVRSTRMVTVLYREALPRDCIVLELLPALATPRR